jgi:hypothetical protein
LKSDYRYSAGVVYNNFPWPPEPAKQRRDYKLEGATGSFAATGASAIGEAAQAVLDARAKYPESSLADLYDPLAMPSDLVKVHRALDLAVDAAYSKKKFSGDADRVAFLFELLQRLLSPLEAMAAR